MKLLALAKHRLFLLSLLVVFSVLVRWLAVRDNKITFWFDQSRDAHVSQQIISERHLKVLGPSASGTNDTVYHGVLYYYFIAPFYFLGKGDPMVPALALSFLGALGIFPLFYFAKSLFNSEKAAWIAVIIYSVSTESIQLAQWLSNPSLAVVPLIVFYWALWEVGYKNQRKFIIPLAIALGLCLQSALWLVCLFGPLLIAVLYNLDQFAKKSVLREWKYVVVSGLIVSALVSTIVLGQYMLWKNGVFHVSSGGKMTAAIAPKYLLNLLTVFFTKLVQSITPAFPVVSFFLGLGAVVSLFRLQKNQKIFFLAWFTAPFWLYVIQPRDSIHILTSLEVAALLIIAWLVAQVWQANRLVPRLIAGGLVVLLVGGNVLAMRQHRVLASSIFSPQQGTDLSMQLGLVKYTYAQAGGKDFSFSAFTNPYGYFITWAYLYDWYGQNHYGYKPTFVGPDQAGLFGESLLKRDDVSRNAIHFTIIEPNLDIVPAVIREKFMAEQDAIGPVVATQFFGSTLIQTRQVKSALK